MRKYLYYTRLQLVKRWLQTFFGSILAIVFACESFTKKLAIYLFHSSGYDIYIIWYKKEYYYLPIFCHCKTICMNILKYFARKMLIIVRNNSCTFPFKVMKYYQNHVFSSIFVKSKFLDIYHNMVMCHVLSGM